MAGLPPGGTDTNTVRNALYDAARRGWIAAGLETERLKSENQKAGISSGGVAGGTIAPTDDKPNGIMRLVPIASQQEGLRSGSYRRMRHSAQFQIEVYVPAYSGMAEIDRIYESLAEEIERLHVGDLDIQSLTPAQETAVNGDQLEGMITCNVSYLQLRSIAQRS